MAVGHSKGMAQFVQDDRFHIIAARFLADGPGYIWVKPYFSRSIFILLVICDIGISHIVKA